MSPDEAALIRLWREKRGEVEPADLSGDLIVQLGVGHRAAEPELVRTQHGAVCHRHPAMGPTPGPSISGGDARRVHLRRRRRVRSQVHAALVVLRRGRDRKVHGPAPAQYVGDQRPIGRGVDHHWRGQMG
jgi:hypothetical protein